MKYAYAFILGLLVACTSAPPPVTLVLNPKQDDSQTNKNAPVDGKKLEIPLVEFNEPSDSVSTSAPPSTDNPLAVVDVGRNNMQYTVSPRREDFNGGSVVYQFVENNKYKIFVSPKNLTVINLEPGERRLSTICGDTRMFQFTTPAVNPQRGEQIVLKASFANKESTMVVNTDRRTYYFILKSYENTFMTSISFNYPIDSLTQAARVADERNNSVTINANISDLILNYRIIPHSPNLPAWAPSVVFSDGTRTYVYFPSARRASYAPVLFDIQDGKRTLLNYTVRQNYYIVDSVIEHAEMLISNNNGNIITIKRVE